ncbi:hypothetical protein Scep_026115 [Stephania cephalantha]|uniref:Uncharacterized protein n=1 Tax=Stephania cephalantha TaxID=152367 RepID=A0AAP0EJJ1_9MAGN
MWQRVIGFHRIRGSSPLALSILTTSHTPILLSSSCQVSAAHPLQARHASNLHQSRVATSASTTNAQQQNQIL